MGRGIRRYIKLTDVRMNSLYEYGTVYPKSDSIGKNKTRKLRSAEKAHSILVW